MFKFSNRFMLFLLLLVGVLSSTITSAVATPIQYLLTFTVDSVRTNSSSSDYSGILTTVGTIYTGMLGVDDAILTSDGRHLAPLLSFNVKFGWEIFDSLYYDTRSENRSENPKFGFDVADNKLVDLGDFL